MSDRLIPDVGSKLKAAEAGVVDCSVRVTVSPGSVAATVSSVVPTAVSSVTVLVVARPAVNWGVAPTTIELGENDKLKCSHYAAHKKN